MTNAELGFDNVTVQYPVYSSRNLSLRNHLVRLGTGGRIESEAGHIQLVTALKDVSFRIGSGESVGLIGPNGAGKSTLLRTMAGVFTPVRGHITRHGRVATVFQLGAGMDPELSGYENITRMSLLLGMRKTEIRNNIREIEAFTQLGEFLELPVRTYSSGMAMRLMFAVATATRPDILLVDEMFSTGDAEFQAKASERMKDLIRSVGIFIFASHNNDLITQYCNRFFHLERGHVREITRAEITGDKN